MPGIVDAIKGFLTGDPIKSITELIQQFHASPELKAQLEQAAAAMEIQRAQIEAARDQALADIAGQNIRAETTSPDKFVSRARPTFLYIIELVLAFNFILLPLMQFVGGKPIAIIALPSDLLWLFGACVLGYTGARSLDKFLRLPGESKLELPFVKALNVSPPK